MGVAPLTPRGVDTDYMLEQILCKALCNLPPPQTQKILRHQPQKYSESLPLLKIYLSFSHSLSLSLVGSAKKGVEGKEDFRHFLSLFLSLTLSLFLSLTLSIFLSLTLSIFLYEYISQFCSLTFCLFYVSHFFMRISLSLVFTFLSLYFFLSFSLFLSFLSLF